MTASRLDVDRRVGRAGRRVGYVAAALFNLLFVWIANRLLEWEWPPFLTQDWQDVLPLVSFSLWATVVVNGLWFLRDPDWFKHLAQLGLHTIGLVVIVRVWEVFPFDLSQTWEVVFRIVLGVGFFGTVIGIVTELAGFVGSARPTSFGSPHHRAHA